MFRCARNRFGLNVLVEIWHGNLSSSIVTSKNIFLPKPCGKSVPFIALSKSKVGANQPKEITLGIVTYSRTR